MFIHPLLPLHVPSRPLPRRVESLAGPTLPGHYICTPLASQDSFPAPNLNSADSGDYFTPRVPTSTSSGLWTPSSSASCPDTPGSCYSQNSEEDNEGEEERLPPAPVRPRSFPPARAVTARKPKSRALADVRRLEDAAERWAAHVTVEGGRRRSYPQDHSHSHSHTTSNGHLHSYPSSHAHPGLQTHSHSHQRSHSYSQGSLPTTGYGNGAGAGSPEGNASGSTPSIYASPEHYDDPMILAWTSPAPVDLAAAVVEEHMDVHDVSGHNESPYVHAVGLPNGVQEHLHGSQSHFNVALLASWGILPSMCKGVSLL